MIGMTERIQSALGNGAGASLCESLMALFQADDEAFYLLACDGARSDDPAWLVEIAELAKRVRDAVRGSYQVERSVEGVHLVGTRVERTFIPPKLADDVIEFLRAVDGKGIGDAFGKDYEGIVISESKARYQLGDRTTWEADRSALQNRLESKPLVLRIDEHDLKNLAGRPGYVTFGLKEQARKTVLAPTLIFQDLMRGEANPGNMSGGMAFCGKPRRGVNNFGDITPAPEGMVFVVYADADGYVFDWDWVEENPHESGCPIDSENRFNKPILMDRDATLQLPVNLPESVFDRSQAYYSVRGDCIFCHIEADESYACRINSDLTVFRSLTDRNKITGFKIKNVRRILAEDQEIILDDDPDIKVSVQTFLLATLRGHRDASVRIYEVSIEAFKKADDIPKVHLPHRRQEHVNV